MQKHLLGAILCFSFFSFALTQNYLDDKSFVGSWQQTTNGKFIRTEIIDSTKNSFSIDSVGHLIRYKEIAAREPLKQYEGTWWSLRMGHFDIQYDVPSQGVFIVERFEYTENENTIHRVGEEEHSLQEQSVFPGRWTMTKLDEDTSYYLKIDATDRCRNCLVLNEDGSGQITKSKRNQKEYQFNITWWMGDNSDYIDVQFYNKLRKQITIEGFQLVKEGELLELRRTRFDELGR